MGNIILHAFNWKYKEVESFLRSPYIENGDEHDPVAVPYNPCADGFWERWIDVGAKEIAALLEQSLKDGNLGFQGNSEGVWSNMNPLIYEVAEAMKGVFVKEMK